MRKKSIKQELENFQRMAEVLIPPPGEIPQLENIDIYGESIPLNSIVGGDHIIYVDFNKRYDLDSRIRQAQKSGREDIKENLALNKTKAGILIVDVAGHSITDFSLAGRLHDAFLTGILYELDTYGEITTRLFETLNTRFYNSLSIDKYITMIYGEINDHGKFRFITAGHPPPLVFSVKYDKLIKLTQGRLTTFPPLGMFPSKADIDKNRNFSRIGYKVKYSINEINLIGSGDILLLYTDGLSEHRNKKEEYFPKRFEQTLKKIKHYPAKKLYYKLKQDILKFGHPSDDISYIVIKKNPH